MEAIPDGPVPLSPSTVIFDWLLTRCFSSAFSDSSWSMSACRASIVSSNSLQRGGQHGTAVAFCYRTQRESNMSEVVLTSLSSLAESEPRPVESESFPLVRLRLWMNYPASSPADWGGRSPHSAPLPEINIVFKCWLICKLLSRFRD